MYGYKKVRKMMSLIVLLSMLLTLLGGCAKNQAADSGSVPGTNGTEHTGSSDSKVENKMGERSPRTVRRWDVMWRT